MEEIKPMTLQEAADAVDSQGLGYAIMEGYLDYTEDESLNEQIEIARAALNAIDNYLRDFYP